MFFIYVLFNVYSTLHNLGTIETPVGLTKLCPCMSLLVPDPGLQTQKARTINGTIKTIKSSPIFVVIHDNLIINYW